MSLYSASTPGQIEPVKKRKHSIKQFVFSSPNRETETATEELNPDAIHRGKPRPKSSEYAFLNRYVRLEHLEMNKEEKVCFIHNHKIVRATKVYVNIYHLWNKWLNRRRPMEMSETGYVSIGTLRTVGLGGGYHTAIEILGMEYQFGGCNQIDSGDFDLAALEMAKEMGPLYKRQVVGLWTGSEADIDILMRHLKEQGNWKGLNYKLLSFNCNHFVKETCDILLKHSRHFHPAKGMTSSTKMVPSYLFKLGDVVKSKSQYLKCVIGPIDEETMPQAEGEHYAFRGRARFTSIGGRRNPFSALFEVREERSNENSTRRHSLPDLRERRIRALDKNTKASKQDCRQPSWNDPPRSSLDQPDSVEYSCSSGQNPLVNPDQCEIQPCTEPCIQGIQYEGESKVKSLSRAKMIKASTSRTDQILSLRRPFDVQGNFHSGRHDRRLDCMPRRIRSTIEAEVLSSLSTPTDSKTQSPNSTESGYGIREEAVQSGRAEEHLLDTLDLAMKLCSVSSIKRDEEILMG